MPSQDDRFNALLERLDVDGELAGALELDTLTTLREMGFDDLIETAEQERDRIGELVDRIYRDDAFRQAVEQDPLAELGEWGIPEMAIAPVLVLAGAPDDVVEQATAAQPQATMQTKPAATAQVTPAAQAQVSPAALTQVSPAARVQVTPAAKAQVSPATEAQVTQPMPKRWGGIQANRLKAQAFSLFRARGL